MIYEDKNTNIQNYLDYFVNIDNIIVLKYSFKTSDFNNIEKHYNIIGYIYPGGNSNITDKSTQYWKYVNLTINKNKPIMAICSGFQHYLKALFPKIILTQCYMYDMYYNNKIHNHRWCIEKKNKKYISDEYKLNYYFYGLENYIESFETNKTLGVIYHPEKISCTDKWKYIIVSTSILNKFYNKLTLIDTNYSEIYYNKNMYIYHYK